MLKILAAINNRIKVMSLFLDLSNAFDRVHHPKLLAKMERMGVKGVYFRVGELLPGGTHAGGCSSR